MVRATLRGPRLRARPLFRAPGRQTGPPAAHPVGRLRHVRAAVARPRRNRPDGDGGGSTSPRPSVVNNTVCGSAQYMSPELLARGPYHGQLAAGVLLYCLVAGRFPYPDNDKMTVGKSREFFFHLVFRRKS